MYLRRSGATTVLSIIISGSLTVSTANAAPTEGVSSESPSTVLATFADSEQVTLRQFSEQYPQLSSWFGLGAKTEAVAKNVEDMVFDDLLAREAKLAGVQNRPKVRRQIQVLLAKEYLREQTSVDQALVSKKELEEYYQANRKDYEITPRWQVSHILTESEAQAHEVYRAAQLGESFRELAKKHSLDPLSSVVGGNLGSVQPKDLAPEILAAASTLRSGEFSKPTKSQFGYHIVRMNEKPAANYKPFAEVKKSIHGKLKQQKQRALIDQIRENLWKKYKVSINHEQLDNVVNPHKPTGAHPGGKITFSDRSLRGKRPSLQLQSNLIHLGNISAEPITREVLVANTGEEEISVKGIGSNCKCATAELTPNELAPGAIGKLAVTYDPTMFQDKGRTGKVLFIESNDRANPRLFVRLDAEVESQG